MTKKASDGCGFAACTIKTGDLCGECRCFGAGPIRKGGHQNFRLQLREAARQIDDLRDRLLQKNKIMQESSCKN